MAASDLLAPGRWRIHLAVLAQDEASQFSTTLTQRCSLNLGERRLNLGMWRCLMRLCAPVECLELARAKVEETLGRMHVRHSAGVRSPRVLRGSSEGHILAILETLVNRSLGGLGCRTFLATEGCSKGIVATWHPRG